MPIKITRPTNILVLFTLALAALGGIFFGLYSCGGYYWHIQAYWISALIFVVGSITLKNQVLNTLSSKLLFPIIYLVLFLASQSVAATFYPSAPESFSEFMRNFLITVEYGPCA
ncbi:hypothetical protein B4P00_17255 [Shewanella xiamenensis]|nr:hypothetical protein [Shewanella xiamenensis]MBW0297951.1 hypothetical protein [Shewanella xiamenensis]PZP37125.1 MAG: hypothetical protein DI594_03880 [Shewanella oneidensis]